MKNNDFNFINKDIIQLDTPEGPKYDIERALKHEYDNEESSCHSGLRAGIQRDDNLMPKTFRFAQSGRSMVEMLGVLAVIGVLSIGGIAGYSYGMDKYRANQTINDISLRTVDLLTQTSQGRTELSLAEWDKETTIYDFANPAYVEGENLIAFDVGTTKKMPQSVCQMVFDGLSNTAVQIDINDSVATSQDNCGNDNTMTFYFEGGGNGTGGETGEQCGDTVCGTCQKCDSATETCVTVANYEQKCTTDDNKTGWCVSGTCEPDTTCNCDEGYYCADKNTSGGNCNSPTPRGNCVEAESQFRTVDIARTTYYISNDKMSWWDAVSACEALGKSLINHNDITQTCNQADDTGCSSAGTKLNTLGEALYSEMGDYYIWSSILYNSCYAYLVYLNDGNVYRIGRYSSGTADAVCR